MITTRFLSYHIAGNFQGKYFRIIKFICGKKFVVYSSVLPQLNHKIKSSWVKHLWFYLNHENRENFFPWKFKWPYYNQDDYTVDPVNFTVTLISLFFAREAKIKNFNTCTYKLKSIT